MPKSTVNNKLKAAIAKAHEESDGPLACRIQSQLKEMLALERVKRKRRRHARLALDSTMIASIPIHKGMDSNYGHE